MNNERLLANSHKFAKENSYVPCIVIAEQLMFCRIHYKTAVDFLLPRHYSGRKPQVKYAYGAYYNCELIAVCTFGIPASHSLCKGIMGEEHKDKVIELNRLCVDNPSKYPFILSQFVSWCLRQLPKNLCVVSYADTEMGHVGYIYQACNFIYTGATKARTDKYSNGHSRHYKENETKRQTRSSKHRYVFFTNKRLQKYLKYPIMPYPTNEERKSQRYILGDFLKKTVIE